jgi:hypothetical protein
MSYLHCHNCSFSQDDFWREGGWNPVYAVKRREKDLFSDKIDESFTDDAQFIKNNGDISLREVVARDFERKARLIREMKYRTLEEFKKNNPERKCPVCKQKTLDID